MFLISVGGWIGIGIAVLFVILIIVVISYFIKTYNVLVQKRNSVKAQWSQVDVQLKRRFDLIPNLVETVKGYAKLEEGIFTEFAKARGLYAQASQSGSVSGAGEAEKGLAGALSRLMVVTEQYPELKANSNFQALMAELSATEEKIAINRQMYNDVVYKYNNSVEMFPSNIVAGMFKFEKAELFEIEDSQKEAPKVQF